MSRGGGEGISWRRTTGSLGDSIAGGPAGRGKGVAVAGRGVGNGTCDGTGAPGRAGVEAGVAVGAGAGEAVAGRTAEVALASGAAVWVSLGAGVAALPFRQAAPAMTAAARASPNRGLHRTRRAGLSDREPAEERSPFMSRLCGTRTQAVRGRPRSVPTVHGGLDAVADDRGCGFGRAGDGLVDERAVVPGERAEHVLDLPVC